MAGARRDRGVREVGGGTASRRCRTRMLHASIGSSRYLRMTLRRRGLQRPGGCDTSGAMSLSLSQKAAGLWAVATRRYDHRIEGALGHWQGEMFVLLHDHGWVRWRWRNEGRIAEGLYRSNQPDARVLAMWKARGVVDVLCLRGKKSVMHALEAKACADLGLRLINVPMATRVAPRRRTLLRLIAAFEGLQRPALIHCKSGADRTGLAAVIWAIHVEGRPVAEARKALGVRHLHLRWTKTGVLDRFLDLYEARVARGPIPIKDWIAGEYDAEALR